MGLIKRLTDFITGKRARAQQRTKDMDKRHPGRGLSKVTSTAPRAQPIDFRDFAPVPPSWFTKKRTRGVRRTYVSALSVMSRERREATVQRYGQPWE